MKQIKLARGKIAIVGDADFDYLNQFKWHNHIGYARRTLIKNNKKAGILMHREILNPLKGKEIDHINHNVLDNRKENLRICTRAENQWNRSINLNNKVNLKGVSLKKGSGKWLAQIQKLGKKIHIGYYSTPQEAAIAYKQKAQELFSEFSLNEAR